MNEFEIVSHRQLGGLSVFFDTVNYRTPHVHPEWELIWLMDAPLNIRSGQDQWTAPPDTLILFPPDRLHEFHMTEKPATFLCLQIAPALFSTAFPSLDRLRTESLFPDSLTGPEDRRKLRRTLYDLTSCCLERPDLYELRCVSLAADLLRMLFTILPVRILTPEELRRQDNVNARVSRLLEFVDKNYMNRIRLSDFAASEGLTVGHVSEFIKKALNRSFQEYVQEVRFNCACRLITEGDTRMLDVCYLSGFSDYRYFSEAFKKRLGMTPEAFSRLERPPVREDGLARRTLQTVEQFYSREESLRLLETLPV